MAMEVADSGTGFRIPVADKGRDRFEEAQLVYITVYNAAGARKKGVEAYMGLVDLASTRWGYWALRRRSGPYTIWALFFFF